LESGKFRIKMVDILGCRLRLDNLINLVRISGAKVPTYLRGLECCEIARFEGLRLNLGMRMKVSWN
jgi:hypothetical protein